jgi:hypothetical protein
MVRGILLTRFISLPFWNLESKSHLDHEPLEAVSEVTKVIYGLDDPICASVITERRLRTLLNLLADEKRQIN